jgi:hypothetical protein
MNTEELQSIKKLLIDLDLLVVSIDRLKFATPLQLVEFLGNVEALDRLASDRRICWDLLERHLPQVEIQKLEEHLLTCQPYWSNRTADQVE